MEMFPFQTALVCSSSYPPVPCQSVVQNPMETVMVHDDSSMSSIPSNDLHNLSLEHNYNKFDMNYECPMLNNNHAYGSIDLCTDDSSSSYACSTPHLQTPPQLTAPTDFTDRQGFSQNFTGSNHSITQPDDSGICTDTSSHVFNFSAIRHQAPQSVGDVDHGRDFSETPTVNYTHGSQYAPSQSYHLNYPTSGYFEGHNFYSTPMKIDIHNGSHNNAGYGNPMIDKFKHLENQSCVIEVRTYDVNDRENSLRVRHQITVPSGTVPDQLDKITTAAVEQVSKDLRQEATFKSNHGLQDVVNETTIEVTRYPATDSQMCGRELACFNSKENLHGSVPRPTTRHFYSHIREQTPSPCILPKATSTPAEAECTPPNGVLRGLRRASVGSDNVNFSGHSHFPSRRTSSDSYSCHANYNSNESGLCSSQASSFSDSGHFSGHMGGYPVTPRLASSVLRQLSTRMISQSSSPAFCSLPDTRTPPNQFTSDSTGYNTPNHSDGYYQSKKRMTPIDLDRTSTDNSLTNIHWLGKMSGVAIPPRPVLNTKSNPEPALVLCTKHIGKESDQLNRNKRPPYSYMHLIKMAISSSKLNRMTLRQIYKWVEDKFPFYKYSKKQGWKNSIRHNLSLYDTFIRQKSNSPGQTGCSYWTLRDDDMSVGLFSGSALMEANSAISTPKQSTPNDLVPLLPKLTDHAIPKPYTIIPIHSEPSIMFGTHQPNISVQSLVVSPPESGAKSGLKRITAHVNFSTGTPPKRKQPKLAPKPSSSTMNPVLHGLLNVNNISTYMSISSKDTVSFATAMSTSSSGEQESRGLPKPMIYKQDSSNDLKSETSAIISTSKGLQLSPFRVLITTPPQSSGCGKIRLTSTPNKTDLCTPLRTTTTNSTWISPIRTSAKNCVTSTPPNGAVSCAILYRTPGSHGSKNRSPKLGSLRDLGLPGLTPLKGQVQLDMNNTSADGSFTINNSSFAKLLGDFHINSIEDLNPGDIANISFSIT